MSKTVVNSQLVNKYLSILNNASYIHINPDIWLSIMFVSKIWRKVSIRTYNIPSSSYLYIAYVRSPPILIWRIMQCKKHYRNNVCIKRGNILLILRNSYIPPYIRICLKECWAYLKFYSYHEFQKTLKLSG